MAPARLYPGPGQLALPRRGGLGRLNLEGLTCGASLGLGRMEISGNCGNGGAFWGGWSGNFRLFFVLFLSLHRCIDLFLKAEEALGSGIFHLGQAVDGMDVLGLEDVVGEIVGGVLVQDAQAGAIKG